jgi:hypothetical protein
MTEPNHERGEDEQDADEKYGGIGQPDDNGDEPHDAADGNDLQRALDSVRDVEEG